MGISIVDLVGRTQARRLVGGLLCGAVAVGLLGGCSANRVNRARAIQASRARKAEVDGLRGRVATLEGTLQSAHAAQDMAQGEARALQDRLAMEDAARQAQANELGTLRAELVDMQGQSAELRRSIGDLAGDYEASIDRQRTAALLAQRSQPPAPTMDLPPIVVGPSPAALALQRDLQDRLRTYGVYDLPVEVRGSGSQERVAVVLPDAFASGKATLHENKRAVQAIVGLGRLIKDQYGSAGVVVEGHTDRDPIVRSGWSSNEHLSQARAEAVRELLESAGVPSSQVRAAGLGASRELDSGSGKEAKSRNRRVEIYIAPNA